MLKGKLKLPAPDKARRVFPDRLGSLVAAFDEKGNQIDGSDFELEPGEELEPIQPGELGFHRESDNGEESIDDDDDDDDKERKIRKRPIKDSVTPVSVLKSISEEEKRSDLEHEISQREINLEKLQRIASTGIPDGGGLRATAWKLLLGYLPSSHDLWDKQLKENRQKYANLKRDILRNPSEHIWKEYEELSSTKWEDSDVDGPLRRHEISHEDHPLSLGKSSLWSQYFQYTEIVEQIDRDLQRTHPDLPFFSGESSLSRKNREAMKNILLLFAKLNPEIRYVQGMNEVLAPIYYVFSTDPDKQNAENVEADSFSCFVRILGDSVDHFCQHLDNSSSGILATLSRLSDLLKVNDEQLWRHLELRTKVEPLNFFTLTACTVPFYLNDAVESHEQVKPQFYAFRWITLLLTQEFKFESILRIWDTLLSNPFGVQDMLLRICCAMLLCVKNKLLSGDFVANLKLLQHYPDDINVEYLLQVAKDISPDTSYYCLSL
ncbi:TBC domain-containing protein C1952.17c isoform X3 [Cajanus cajan]|uniref:TBC domain-containing protein C1952.17c isoform X3 n=1 Tax=Cajanus cajan TaxID=3821 RepID=UPI00098DB35D|nr:TBC domain-containing protein C1952.17c isoform X3 [Cajanus cajan]